MGTRRVSAPRLGNGRGARIVVHGLIRTAARRTRTAPGMQRQESGTDAIGELHAGTGLAPKFNLIKRLRAALCERSLAERIGGRCTRSSSVGGAQQALSDTPHGRRRPVEPGCFRWRVPIKEVDHKCSPASIPAVTFTPANRQSSHLLV
ncbi:hypothetical protein MRX96_036147 [Rhipicephalus microplus]